MQTKKRARWPTDPGAWIGVGMVVAVLFLAWGAPWLAPHDPTKQHLVDAFGTASAVYPLGADHLGRDLLSRLLFGARNTLGTALLVLSGVLVIALGVGLAAGYWGGWLDNLLMRLVDLLLAFPGLILAVAICGTFGGNLLNLTLALGVVWWAGYARVIRSSVLTLREQPFIEAARATGVPDWQILTRYLLRNVVSPLIVLASFDIGNLILSIAALNFLGLGAQPPTPEWGAMLNDAHPFLQTEPHLVLLPAAAIVFTVLGFSLLGDGVRDWLDPRGGRL